MYCLVAVSPSLLPPPSSLLPPSDVEKIHDGIGDKVALFVQWISTFFGGFVIGFFKDWRLTLVLVGFTPFLVICGSIFSVVNTLTVYHKGAIAPLCRGMVRVQIDSSAGSRYCSYAGGPLRQYRACAGISSEWSYMYMSLHHLAIMTLSCLLCMLGILF